MRLISCHIENFGKLSDFTYDFKPGVNVFLEDNGWGKSTLAAFLRVMFFGLSGDRIRNDLDNDRRRYKPWQGGAFGGNVVFEADDKRYIVTRIFKDKEANDIFELRDYDTNLLSNDFSQSLGEELFKINSDSFLRTVFISQNDCVTEATDSINAKIGNITDNTGDIDSFEKAMDIFKNYLNEHSPSKSTGSINKLKSQRTELLSMINGEASVPESLAQYEERLENNLSKKNELIKAKDSVLEMSAKVSKYTDSLANKKVFDKLTEDIEAAKAELESAKAFFPVRVPNENEVNSLRNETLEHRDAENLYKLRKPSDEDSNRYLTLKNRFERREASDEELDTLSNNIRVLKAGRKAMLENSVSLREEARLRDLTEFFNGIDNPAMVSARLNTEYSDMKSEESLIEIKKANRDMISLRVSEQKKKLNPIVFLVLSILFLLTSIVPLALGDTVIPAIRFGILTVFVVAGIIFFTLFLIKKIKSYVPSEEEISLNNLNKEIDDRRAGIERRKEFIVSTLSGVSLNTDEAMLYTSIQTFASKASEYASLLEIMAKAPKVDSAKLDEESRKIRDFLCLFNESAGEDEFEDALIRLTRDAHDYKRLKEQAKTFDIARERFETLHADITKHFADFGFTDITDFENLIKDISIRSGEVVRLSGRYRKLSQDKAVFASEHEMNFDESYENLMTMEELSERLKAIDAETEELDGIISQDKINVDSLRERLDKLSDTKEAYESIDFEIESELNKYKLVERARDFLKESKENLTKEYMTPLLSGFTRYYSSIAGETGNEFHMDANAILTFDDKGMQRNISSLSAGYKDLIGVCLRAAFVDAMYESESPVLFLDDPFVNLDDTKIKGGRNLLNEISKKYQVIYFTCSSQRA